ncbi:CUB and sushi domain-containing protein 1 [Liparis tanakae]|uniref:CUB and sushi domain-containing protein 1 n=1 Tax=Liparis tanakae TaxID=230148 RepID=A0A4Z2I2R0_9TELE|nr:CUB and sushi domain-containing protein 1 [Liparis tanakae]
MQQYPPPSVGSSPPTSTVGGGCSNMTEGPVTAECDDGGVDTGRSVTKANKPKRAGREAGVENRQLGDSDPEYRSGRDPVHEKGLNSEGWMRGCAAGEMGVEELVRGMGADAAVHRCILLSTGVDQALCLDASEGQRGGEGRGGEGRGEERRERGKRGERDIDINHLVNEHPPLHDWGTDVWLSVLFICDYRSNKRQHVILKLSHALVYVCTSVCMCIGLCRTREQRGVWQRKRPRTERQTTGVAQRRVKGRAESCGGVVQGLNGSIESPGFPHGYPNYANCTWLIITGERNRIQLTFVTLALEEDFDIVSVYDGQPSPGNLKLKTGLVCVTVDKALVQIGYVSGSEVQKLMRRETSRTIDYNPTGFMLPSPIVSSGSILALWFTTDFAVSAQGFKAVYEGLRKVQWINMASLSNPQCSCCSSKWSPDLGGRPTHTGGLRGRDATLDRQGDGERN